MKVFELEHISLAYPVRQGSRVVLGDISFDLNRGEILTIVGASGSGKTSLLRILAGLTSHVSGVIKFNGCEVAGPQAGVAIVFQDYTNALLPWRTVAGNISLGLEAELSRNELKERVKGAVHLVGLEKHLQDYPWQLSGGMQQRVQIARALALKPSVLLMDEPFASLDAMTKATLQDEILKVREQTDASIVFITHDIEEAVYLGDRIAVLTGSPGIIGSIFHIDLPKPRNQLITRSLPGFLVFRRSVHEAIGAI